MRKREWLLAFLAGVFLPLAFAPFEIFPIAVFSLAVFFCLCREKPPRHSFNLGLIFGLGYFGLGVSWVQVSIHQFGIPILAFSVSITFLFVLLLASFPALLAYVVAKFFPEDTISVASNRLLVIYPALWVVFEWIRSWFLTGFPWLTIGYSQIDSPLAGLAPVTGVYGVSLAVAITAGAVGLLWVKRKAAFQKALLAVLPIWIGGYILQQIAWTSPAAEEVNVAMVQGNVAQEMKWVSEQRQVTLDLYSQLSETFWGEVDLIIWPETALPAFAQELGEYIDKQSARVKESGTDLLLGVPFAEGISPTGQFASYYNSVITLKHGTDQSLDIYHKQHLVPFGEYLPLEKILDPVLSFLQIPMSRFSAGSAEQTLITSSKHQIGISICYEDVFGEEVNTGLPEADFLVNVSNDAWFGDSLAPHQHLEMARMRALETGRYMARSTNTGVSAIIDQQGRIIKQAEQFKETVLAGKLRIFSGVTPYTQVGNLPVIIFCFLTVILAYLIGRRR